ncbi:MAG: valine--tRNA ligase [Armatimonadetes bacterium]|nr:valine--tRNA ligase [Armatimonadota bacterium]
MAFEMEKAYEPQNIERRIYQYWMDERVFDANVNPDKPSYCIVIPPPNVTGILHMGHALDNTIQDLLIRWKRMSGFEALWLPGTDHAGIATQNVTERLLAEEGITRHDLGREEFVKRTWQVKEKHHSHIVEQLKRFGSSLDWRRERFTMDEGLSRAVREAFVLLWEQGLIYRGDYMVNWCPRCATGLSDLEVEDTETAGHLWRIRYTEPGGGPGLVIATTRPETMLGDTAVAVHPDDERYKHLVGKTLILPLMGREIPVIADDYLDMEFGTGALKVTPAHDPNDLEIARRHNLPEVVVIGKDGRMTAEAGQYAGMERYECRKQVVADLEALGLLEGVEEHNHTIPHCSRCSTVLEPLVSTQWFVRMRPLADKGLRAVADGRVRFVPERWTKVYRDWLENIRDWPISRQLWWGHPIPVWYCDDCGEMICSREDPTRCDKCGSTNLRQDEDVLDTWFSSQLWPFSTLGWPDKTPELDYFFPTSVLVTAYDIIYFWVARMIMAALQLTDNIPFHDVFIHGLVRDEKGRKISKSLGNNIDPIELIDNYGADAMRFALTQLITHGQDLSLVEDRFVGARNFGNKLWNASRFVLMNLESAPADAQIDPALLTTADRWILSRHQKALAEVNRRLDRYDLAEAAGTLYEHVWNEFCDWYVELAKIALYSDDPARKQHTQAMLSDLLSSILRALHPFMPFITEEIWQRWRPQDGPIALQAYPLADDALVDDGIEAKMALMQEVLSGVRSMRGDFGIPRGTKAAVTLIAQDQTIAETLAPEGPAFRLLADVSELTVLTAPAQAPGGTVPGMAAGVELYLHLGDAVDVAAELARIDKQVAAAEKDIQRAEGKLGNEKFTANAPEAVVAKERAILEEARATLGKLKAQRAALEALEQ